MIGRRGFLGTLASAVFAVALDILPTTATRSIELQLAETPIEVLGYFSIADLLEKQFGPDPGFEAARKAALA